MHASSTDAPELDVESFAQPLQQRRFSAAMEKIAADRAPGTPVRVYVSAPPRAMTSPKWGSWLEGITQDLPDGVEVLHYYSAFSDGRVYDWETFAANIDGLVMVGKQKRAGSRTYRFGPVARLELRSLIARRPVLLYAHSQGLIPVIDCKSQVIDTQNAPRLKLTVPKQWRRADQMTLKAALAALTPDTNPGQEHPAANHLAHPFAPFTSARPGAR